MSLVLAYNRRALEIALGQLLVDQLRDVLLRHFRRGSVFVC